QLQDGVAVVDTRVVEVHIRRAIRPRAGSDDDFLGHQAVHCALGIHQLDGIGIGKTALAEKQVNAVARVITAARTHLAGDNLLRALEHVREGKIPWLPHRPEDRVGVELDDLLDGITQRLGRNGAEVDAIAAYHIPLFDHRYPAAVLRRIDRRAFTSRAGTQYHHIVVIYSHSISVLLQYSCTLRAARAHPLRVAS